ncbi:MAG: HaeII family restriction endonuclease [Chitinophagales bacterium]|nr:HaeII family restriction endonuclease [Chitinophagales bacterium]
MEESSSKDTCEESILKMLRKSQTKVIFPVITFALVKEYNKSRKETFTDGEIRKAYSEAVIFLKNYLNHNLHIGGKYYDAYPVRNLPKYGVLKVSEKQFLLQPIFKKNAKHLEKWIPEEIKKYIEGKIGIIPNLSETSYRMSLASDLHTFSNFIADNISLNPSNFEIFSFSIIKVHLEKFACKIYRDTRTSAHDQGVDLSTNFGAVYQIKKLKILNKKVADEIYSEIKLNFDDERMSDGKVIIIIDDISKDVKKHLIDMKVQSISKNDVIKLSNQFEEIEDRMKVLRVIYDEFRREYESQIK